MTLCMTKSSLMYCTVSFFLTVVYPLSSFVLLPPPLFPSLSSSFHPSLRPLLLSLFLSIAKGAASFSPSPSLCAMLYPVLS